MHVQGSTTAVSDDCVMHVRFWHLKG